MFPWCKGRPIVSACSCPTEHISSYLDKVMTPVVKSLPSYIKDSNHALEIFRNFNFSGENKIIFIMDITSLYTIIPNNEGLQALKYFFNQRPIKKPSSETLLRPAPLHPAEKNLTYLLTQSILFPGSKIHLGNFRKFISWAFLDIKLSINYNGLSTSVHYKPTDSHNYLLHSSSHQQHVKNAIPFSQFRMASHICATESSARSWWDMSIYSNKLAFRRLVKRRRRVPRYFDVLCYWNRFRCQTNFTRLWVF